MISTPAWSTKWIPGQAPKLHRETLSQKKKNKTKENKTNKQKEWQGRKSLPALRLEIEFEWIQTIVAQK